MKKAKRMLAMLLSLIMVCTMVSACSSSKTNDTTNATADTSSTADTTTTTDANTGSKTVTIMHNEAMSGFDMFSGQIGGAGTSMQMLWGDQLVNTDHMGNYTPWLATEWTMADDSMSITFKLRNDVVFSDGTPMTAADVVYTFERLRDDTTLANAGKWTPFIDTVEATDDYTVTLNFKAPMANFWSQLSQLPIICKTAYEANKDGYWDAPIGSGPYTVSKNDLVDGVVELTKRDDYWGWAVNGTTSNVDKIVFKYSAEDTSRVSALRAGEIQVCESVPVSDVTTLQDAGLTVVQQNELSHNFLGLNCATDKIFNNEKAREALSLCIDRSTLVSSILGAGVAADWACNADAVGYVGSGYQFDLEKAKQLLKDSGYNGEEIVFLATNSMPRVTEVAQAIQAMMTDAGFNVKVDMNENATYMDRRFGGDFDITLGNFTGNCNDWYVECAEIIGKNLFGTAFENKELTDLCTSLSTTADPEVLKDIYTKIYQTEMDNFAPNISLYQTANANAFVSDLSGITFYPERTADYRFMVMK